MKNKSDGCRWGTRNTLSPGLLKDGMVDTCMLHKRAWHIAGVLSSEIDCAAQLLPHMEYMA